MKGIILAGESGTKLHPMTLGIPKCLIPIYDRPMIYFPLSLMVEADIRDILIITTPNQLTLFQKALGNGESFGVNLSYACQQSPEGVAQAIKIGEDFMGNDSVCLTTGDTIIIGKDFASQLKKAIKAADKSANATIFVDKDYSPEQFGRVILDKNRRFKSIVGKSDSTNYYAITGIYVFPNKVIRFVSDVQISERNLYEITTVNRFFLEDNKLQIQKINANSIWFDTNTPDSLLKLSNYIQQKGI